MVTTRPIRILGSQVATLAGLSDAQIQLFVALNVETYTDLMLLDADDFLQILGNDDATFIKRKRLAAIVKYLRLGNTIDANTLMSDIITGSYRTNTSVATGAGGNQAPHVSTSAPIKLSPSDIPNFTGEIEEQDSYKTKIEEDDIGYDFSNRTKGAGHKDQKYHDSDDDIGYDFSNRTKGAGHKDQKYHDSDDENESLSQDENERHTHLKRVVDDSYDAQRMHLKPATKRTSINDYGEDMARETTQNLDHNSGLSRKHRKRKTYSNKKNRDTSIHTEQEDGIESVTSSVAASFQGKGNGKYLPSIDSDSSDFESNTKKRKSSKTSLRNDPSGSWTIKKLWTPKNKENRKKRNSSNRDSEVLISSSSTSPARPRRLGRKRAQV